MFLMRFYSVYCIVKMIHFNEYSLSKIRKTGIRVSFCGIVIHSICHPDGNLQCTEIV